MNDPKKTENNKGCYTFANLIGDIIGVILILLICEAFGCSVFEGIGHAFGKCTNAYKQTTQQIHPSELR